jgi:hypothetical protein
MFKTWMVTSSVGRMKSRPFCCWDAEAIVEVGGMLGERNARQAPRSEKVAGYAAEEPDRTSTPSRHIRLIESMSR